MILLKTICLALPVFLVLEGWVIILCRMSSVKNHWRVRSGQYGISGAILMFPMSVILEDIPFEWTVKHLRFVKECWLLLAVVTILVCGYMWLSRIRRWNSGSTRYDAKFVK